MTSIWTGISGLTALLLVAGAIAWYLLLSPLAEPAPRLADSPANRRWRERLILFYIGSQVLLSVGSFWDVAWHMRFGILRQDFWWPPHIMIYIGFFADAVIAGLALGRLLRAKGRFRARFRLDPLVGALFLAATTKLVFAPLDEVWHRIYGADISGLSTPHIFLALAGGLELFLILTMAVRSLEERFWRSVAGWSTIVMLGYALWGWLMITVGDFEAVGFHGKLPPFHPAFARPAWTYLVLCLLPATVVLTAAVRVIGGRWTASLIALAGNLYVGLCYLVLTLWGNPLPLWASPLYILVGAVCMDLVRQVRVQFGPIAFGAGYLVSAAAGTMLATKVVSLDGGQLLVAAVAGLAGAALCGAIGQGIGSLSLGLGGARKAA